MNIIQYATVLLRACRGAYDLIVVGTQESALVPKLADEGMEEEDVSRMSSPGPPSPSAGLESAYSDSAAHYRPMPPPGLGDMPHQRCGQAPEHMYPPEDAQKRHMDTGMAMRPLSPERSSSAPVPASQIYPGHVPRPRGYVAQHLHSPGAPMMPGVLTAPFLAYLACSFRLVLYTACGVHTCCADHTMLVHGVLEMNPVVLLSIS